MQWHKMENIAPKTDVPNPTEEVQDCGGGGIGPAGDGNTSGQVFQEQQAAQGANGADLGGDIGGGGGSAHQELLEASDTSTKDNANYSEIIKNGEKVYECNVCSDNFDQPSKVKRHITMKHVKPVGETRLKRVREDDLEEIDNKKHKSQYVFTVQCLRNLKLRVCTPAPR